MALPEKIFEGMGFPFFGFQIALAATLYVDLIRRAIKKEKVGVKGLY